MSENATPAWLIASAGIEAVLVIVLVVFYYPRIWRKDFPASGPQLEQSIEGRVLSQFYTVVMGFFGSFILYLIWGRLVEGDWWPLVILTLETFLLFDNWYGGYRRYSKLPYYPSHFILDIALLFIFLLMAYAAIMKTTLVVVAIYLYALHGLLWDIHYAGKIASNTWERTDLESSLHYASLLALTFVGIQFYFGWTKMSLLDWKAVAFILGGWLTCRIFLIFHQKQKRAAFLLKKDRNKQYEHALSQRVASSLLCKFRQARILPVLVKVLLRRPPFGRIFTKMRTQYVRAWSRDKLELHGLLCEPGEKPKRTVLHVHGTAGNFYENRFIDVIAEQLVSNSFSFLTSDNRGRDYISDFLKLTDAGLTSVRIGSSYEIFEESINDIGGWIDFLTERDYKDIVLEGHSTGALKVTFYQSQTQDSRVAGIILMSASDDIGLRKRSLGGRFAESLEVAQDMVKQGKGKEFMPDWAYDFPISARTYLDLFGSQSKSGLFQFSSPTFEFTELKKIRCPILAFYGTEKEATVGSVDEALTLIKNNATSSAACEIAKIVGAPHNYRGYEKRAAGLIVDWLLRTLKSA
ncbi:MAG: alpha/beta hydrolase [Phycisphaerae bacterium]